MQEEKNENKIEKNIKPKCYVLDMFAYPSGEGLHIGHAKVYTATDVYARYKRACGYDVLHPTGFDAFGLPAEQYAIKNKLNPKISTAKNCENFIRQMKDLKFSYDYDNIASTTDPEFYKWTQWIFKQLYKKGLAYESFEPINWCPSCKTGLANEDLEGNACERCGTIVEKKPLRQWSLAITKYADRLLDDLDTLNDWPEWLKDLQRNWIGRSEGAEIEFKIIGGDKNISFNEHNNSGLVGYGTNIEMNTTYSFEKSLKIFTTRADTIFGCTFMAINYSIAKQWIESGWVANNEVKNFINKSEEEDKTRTIDFDITKLEKEGVDTGIKAINPANGKEIPVYIANYVLSDYGTGAVMAVPAHDERDYEFAEKYGLEILDVICKKYLLTGNDAERPGAETLVRRIVDPIVRDLDNNFYLIKEPQDGAIHFAGGGIDEGEDEKEALRREIIEELGFTNFEIRKKIQPQISCWGYRHTKNKNQRTVGLGYEVVLLSLDKQPCEIEEGKHEMVVVSKEKVLETVTWEHHRYLFENYIKGTKVFTEEGTLFNSSQFDGMTSEKAKAKIVDFVGGKMVKKYKLKEWVFARQRYWGEPFPVVYATDENGERDHNIAPIMVADSELPVLLPDVESYEPTGTGESPLAGIKSFTDVYGYINEEGEFESVNGAHSERELKTIDYYKNQSQDYLVNTETNPENILSKFKLELNYISEKLKDKKVLEIGSASGRDAIYLKNKGLKIICSDISNAFENKIKDLGFEFFNFDPTTDSFPKEKYDGILGLASLLHSETSNIKKILVKINLALNDNGFVYLRMKNGNGELEENGKGGFRFFNFVNEEKIHKLLLDSGFDIERIIYSEADKWINILAKKIKTLEPKLFKRETNTMPQWAGSSWYWLRFMDPKNDNEIFSQGAANKWGQVDKYVGGAEHATRHLIYGRFWHKFLYDLGLVKDTEPFKSVECVGLVLGEGGVKMSKRLGNIINPDDMISQYGVDATRVYAMFMAPFGQASPWDSKSIVGVQRFLSRVEKLKEKVNVEDILKNKIENNFESKDKNSINNSEFSNSIILNQTIKKVGEDIENFKFNTAISQMMICLNEFESLESNNKNLSLEDYKKFLTILAPFAPTLFEKLEKELDLKSEWPKYDKSKLQSDTVKIALQINGKLRDTFDIALNSEENVVIECVKNLEAYKKYVVDAEGKSVEPKKIIVVKNKIVNVVV